MMHLKTVIPVGLAVGLFFQATAFAAFPDVPAGHHNYEAVLYVQQEGIVSGYLDGTFQPDRTINRAEFLKIVMNGSSPESTDVAACGENDQRGSFNDVPGGQWYSPFICRAKNAGFVSGYPDGTFRPATSISFVEAAKIVTKAFDMPTTSDAVWYKPFVDALAQKQAIPSSIRSFDQLITRGEMAEMIYGLKTGKARSTVTYESLQHSPTAVQYNDQTTTLAIVTTSYGVPAGEVDCRINAYDQFNDGIKYIVAPNGGSVAYVGCDKNKYFIFANNTFKSGLDEIWGPVFSDDGRHVAFFFKKDNAWTVSVDGKEQKLEGALGGTVFENMAFSPAGKFVYILKDAEGQAVVIDGVKQDSYTELSLPVFKGSSMAYRANTAERKTFVIFNDRKGKDYIFTTKPVISPDGKKVAYIGVTAWDEKAGTAECVIVIGNEEKPYDCSDAGIMLSLIFDQFTPITFSEDGEIVAYTVLLEKGEYADGIFPEVVRPPKVALSVNGTLGKSYNYIHTTTFNPSNDKVAYIVSDTEKPDNSFVVYDNKEGKKYLQIGPYPGTPKVYMSPNGSSWAYVGVVSKEGCRQKSELVTNGNVTQAFTGEEINNITYSPNGQRMAINLFRWIPDSQGCVADSVLLVDGTEKKDFLDGAVFSADSSHLAYVGGETLSAQYVVVDDRRGTTYDSILTAPIFTSDGKHVAYAVRQGKEIRWIVDEIR